jgi:hypothetical protein
LVQKLLSAGTPKIKRKKHRLLFFFWWQVWKERNRRIFDARELSVPQLSWLLKDQIHMFNLSHHTD